MAPRHNSPLVPVEWKLGSWNCLLWLHNNQSCGSKLTRLHFTLSFLLRGFGHLSIFPDINHICSEESGLVLCEVFLKIKCYFPFVPSVIKHSNLGEGKFLANVKRHEGPIFCNLWGDRGEYFVHHLVWWRSNKNKKTHNSAFTGVSILEQEWKVEQINRRSITFQTTASQVMLFLIYKCFCSASTRSPFFKVQVCLLLHGQRCYRH